MFILCCPLFYSILQRGCCRNFIYGRRKCSSVAFRVVCGTRSVTHRPGYSLSRDPPVGGPVLTQRGSDPAQGVWLAYLGVPDRTRRPGLSVQGSGALSWRSGPTDVILEYITSSGHVVSLGPPTWWSRVLFTTRPEIAAQAPCLHTVVRGTPDSGYRHILFCYLV
jgi:hypothetical protein